MNTKDYKGQKIIAWALARLVPPNDGYPDCMCELVLTERSLYVLEDNYNNTYTEHFNIPVRRISNIRILGGSMDASPITKGVIYALLTLLGFLIGIFVFIIGNTKNKLGSNYMRLDYNDEWGENKELYFRELDRSAKKIVDRFNKIKSKASER